MRRSIIHYARLIEMLAALEHIEQLLDDPELISEHLRAQAGINNLEAVGCQRGARAARYSTTTRWTSMAC